MGPPCLPSPVQAVHKASSQTSRAGRKKGRCRGEREAEQKQRVARRRIYFSQESAEEGGGGEPLVRRPPGRSCAQFPVRGAALGAEWSHQKGGFSLPSLLSAAANKEERERRHRHTLTAWRRGMALPSSGQGGSLVLWGPCRAAPQPLRTRLPMAGKGTPWKPLPFLSLRPAPELDQPQRTGQGSGGKGGARCPLPS